MVDGRWNPWKISTLALALVMGSILVVGLVRAQRAPVQPEPTASVAPLPSAPPAPAPVPGTHAGSARRVARHTPGVPTRAVVQACNRYAAEQVGHRDKTVDTVKDVLIGTAIGGAVGAAGGAIADGGSGAGKGAAIGGVAGAAGGTLYGLTENRRHDERYRDAYGACMRARGYRA